jgi:DNA invertase Pin-like site-specific DNA recombinase
VNGEYKIQGAHRERVALVYLRQSSMAQVREHTESTMRQYGLVEEAVRLGWARQDVEVIDTDLGISGRWGVTREGFDQLVVRVCRGEVGAIFGIEISRLARSNADVARLMEFARITATLLIDPDGVYDPADVNDRMLLGLKGTMGEVELHVMAGRLQQAKRAAALRGELRTPLPVGYVHDEDGGVVIDPDAEVQAAVADVFGAFAACGSAYGVVAAFAGRRFPLRAYGGAWAGQLRWGRLTHARVVSILKNPGYAGAYVFGRYCSRRTVDPDGKVHTFVVEQPRDQWAALLKQHHPGYISWADYLANEAKLAANRTNAGARPPREGSALCQGITCDETEATMSAETTWSIGFAEPAGGDRGARVPRSGSSTDGHCRPHPGMDEALEAVDSRRKRRGRHCAAGRNRRRREGPAGEPRALRHRGQPQEAVEGLDAAAAEVGDLGERVVLAAAVVRL